MKSRRGIESLTRYDFRRFSILPEAETIWMVRRISITSKGVYLLPGFILGFFWLPVGSATSGFPASAVLPLRPRSFAFASSLPHAFFWGHCNRGRTIRPILGLSNRGRGATMRLKVRLLCKGWKDSNLSSKCFSVRDHLGFCFRFTFDSILVYGFW